MNLSITKNNIKCDTIMCHNIATTKLETGSYKGDTFLCDLCFKKLKNIFKRDKILNEEK